MCGNCKSIWYWCDACKSIVDSPKGDKWYFDCKAADEDDDTYCGSRICHQCHDKGRIYCHYCVFENEKFFQIKIDLLKQELDKLEKLLLTQQAVYSDMTEQQ